MNYCRTCKYWGIRAHMVGVGMCMNATQMVGKLIIHDQMMFTAQDFGCVGHEPGEQNMGIETPQSVKDVRREFMGHILGNPNNL